MKIFDNYRDLPKKIQRNFTMEIYSNYITAFKTSYKPSHQIPILWLVIHKNGLLFCSTHKTQGVFKYFSNDEIDSIKIKVGMQFVDAILEILLTDLKEDDFVVTIPKEVDLNKLESILLSQNFQIIK